MKNFFNKIKNHILITFFIFLGIFIITNIILNLFNMRFQLWFIILMLGLLALLFVIGLIQTFIRKDKVFKIVTSIFVGIFIMLCIVFYQVILLVLAFLYKPEHFVILDEHKYIAVVNSFLSVDVDYYDYYNPFIMGTKVKVHGYFGEGGYDPFEKTSLPDQIEYYFYDDDGKVIYKKYVVNIKNEDGKVIDNFDYTENNEKIEYNENDNYILPIDEEVFYEKKFDNVILRFSKLDSVLGQNSIVHVLKSTNNGEDFTPVSESYIKVSNEAKFTFLTEDLGFAITAENIKINNLNNSVYVTLDGGKTFQNAQINYSNNEIEYLKVTKVPYLENDELILDCSYIIKKDERVNLKFFSTDQGLTWNLKNQ